MPSECFSRTFWRYFYFTVVRKWQIGLLNLNGYTFESVGRQFDEICRKAFKIGFSREMTIALIEKRNRELAKSNIKFAPIPNLTSNKG